MKKLFSLFVICTLVISTGIVGCGGTADNSTKKTDTGGKAPPKNSKTEDEAGGKAETAAGGEAKSETAPN